MSKIDLDDLATQAKIYARALQRGWTVYQTSMYDEEGVEGWTWEEPNGNTYCELGDWEDLPAIPMYAAMQLLED